MSPTETKKNTKYDAARVKIPVSGYRKIGWCRQKKLGFSKTDEDAVFQVFFVFTVTTNQNKKNFSTTQ